LCGSIPIITSAMPRPPPSPRQKRIHSVVGMSDSGSTASSRLFRATPRSEHGEPAPRSQARHEVGRRLASQLAAHRESTTNVNVRHQSQSDGYALARPVPSHEGNGRSSKSVYAQKRRQLRSGSQVHRRFHLAATVWGGSGTVDETEPIHPLTHRIEAWSRPAEPTVEHRIRQPAGSEWRWPHSKATVKNLVSRAFIESYRDPAAELATPFSIRQEALGQL
jgi:hypothetical protein